MQAYSKKIKIRWLKQWNVLRTPLELFVSPQLKERFPELQCKTTVELLADQKADEERRRQLWADTHRSD